MKAQQRTILCQAYPATLFSGLLLSGGSIYIKERKSIAIAMEGGYESWNLALPGGELSGLEPELIVNLYQQMQIECKLVIQNWDGTIAGLNIGKYDMTMDAIVVTPERSKVVAFTQAYAVISTFLTAVKGSLLPPFPIVKLYGGKKGIQVAIAPLRTALKGRTIGIVSGAVYTPFIDKCFRNIADIREYNNLADAILDLQTERIDAVLDDITFANTTPSRPENNNLVSNGPLTSGPIWGDGEAMGVRLTDTDLKAKLDSATQAVLAGGTVKELGERQFKSNVTP